MDVNLDDLLDAGEVAGVLELENRRVVSAYRSQYDDFPEPVISKSAGKCQLWLRADIEAWRSRHPGRER